MAAANGAGTRAWEDMQSRSIGGRCLCSACVGWQPPTTRAHELGGRGVVLSRWSLLKGHFRWLAAPNGGGPLAGGTVCRSRWVVATYGAPVGHIKHQLARAHVVGGRGVLPGRWPPPM